LAKENFDSKKTQFFRSTIYFLLYMVRLFIDLVLNIY
jgi:hypothetical protein